MATNGSISTLLEQIKQLVHASLRPLPPRFGDGRYNSDVSPEQIKTGIVKDLASQAARVPEDIDLLVNIIQILYRNGLQNDSKYFVRSLNCACDADLSGRWRSSSNSLPPFPALLPPKRSSPTALLGISGAFSSIHLFRTSAISISIARQMVATMYHPINQLFAEMPEYPVPAPWKGKQCICQECQARHGSDCCTPGCRSAF
jgi:hypothetical protein